MMYEIMLSMLLLLTFSVVLGIILYRKSTVTRKELLIYGVLYILAAVGEALYAINAEESLKEYLSGAANDQLLTYSISKVFVALVTIIAPLAIGSIGANLASTALSIRIDTKNSINKKVRKKGA